MFPYKLAPSVPSNILRNPPFGSLASFWIVSLTRFNNKPESSRDLTISIRSFILSFGIVSVVVFGAEQQPDATIFLCIPASAADDAAINSKRIKTL